MARVNKLTDALYQHKELWWLLGSIVICVTGLFGIATTAFIWYL